MQVGTVRYMAPELLDGSIDLSQFNSFLQADVYAFTLTIWEVLANTRKGIQHSIVLNLANKTELRKV